MDALYHLPLERYKQRYTEWLGKVERAAFNPSFDYVRIKPKSAGTAVLNIQSGEVLDSFARPLWALEQIERLITTVGTKPGMAYFSDFYTPGLDALPYAGTKLEIGSFLWAQTFDQYDFTTKFISWMRPWEVMAFDIYSYVFVAHDMLRELIVSALPSADSKLHTVGLPFSTKIVKAQFKLKDATDEKYHVVYSSRWDKEKNPDLFLDLANSRKDLRFVVCTGHDDLRGSDKKAVERAKRMAKEHPSFSIATGLTKSQYYAILSGSKVQFNCALQDWVSFTLLEALTFGCAPLYPNMRSFPDSLGYYSPSLYRPYDVSDAGGKLDDLLTHKFPKDLRREILDYHDGTMQRVAAVMKG